MFFHIISADRKGDHAAKIRVVSKDSDLAFGYKKEDCALADSMHEPILIKKKNVLKTI